MATKVWLVTLWFVAGAVSGCSNASSATQPTAAGAGAPVAGESGPTGAAGMAVHAPVQPSTLPVAGTGAASTPPAAGAAAGRAADASGAAGTGVAQAGQPAASTAGRAAAGSGEAPSTPQPASGFDYPSGEVALGADLVIPAGKTVRVGPGTAFKASRGVKVQVHGELIVEADAEHPTTFAGNGMPRSWHGIVIEGGGKLKLEHAHISGATYGMFAQPGSQFSVDSSVIDTSFKAAVVQSNGTFTRTRFVATVPETVSLASEVSVDDPNGALTIIDASPTITDCRFDGASTVTDLVRIGGMSSPTFDHVYLHDAHCAFHTFGGTNTSARISNALIENFSYAFMAYTTKPIVENSVFKNNGNDFGICLGATEANAPVLKSNFYSSGEVLLDPSCFGIGIADSSPAAAAQSSAGTVTKF